mmetsp:Transcript_8862/g.18409  ORF Transcript_8862/g.18409 Transcript_8862/m.18409 type:complete len:624 (-) Transcript_8862:192-2063(-)
MIRSMGKSVSKHSIAPASTSCNNILANHALTNTSSSFETHDGFHRRRQPPRYFGSTSSNRNQDREFSSLALPLAKTSHGIVNVHKSKSTSHAVVPRPRVVVPDNNKNAKTVPLAKLKRLNGWNLNGCKVATDPSKAAAYAERAAETLIELEHVIEEVTKKMEASPSHIAYAGSAEMPITEELKIVKPGEDTPSGIWPVFRMMDEDGHFRQESGPIGLQAVPQKHDLDQLRSSLLVQNPQYSREIHSCSLLHPSKHVYPDMPKDNDTSTKIQKNSLLRAHRQMIRLRKMDTILHNAQRQGRISFYMTCHGEESIHIGSASALRPQDHVFAQYREAGILMWRGFTLEQFCNQCFSNDLDLGRGRQMPVHYGCRALNYHTISSPLGTQLTQAVGAAYKLKLDYMASSSSSDNPKEAAIAIAYFGEGAASTIDFHSACNFASTIQTPMIFFCRNNGYAISTPTNDQYAGDGIVSRAPGYGMAGIRVDGNDLFAVHAAVREARNYALETSSPVMIEAMTYRQGHHSTSDDSSRYRDGEEVRLATDVSDPIVRLDRFLERYGWMNETDVASVEDEERLAVLKAMEGAESRPDPSLSTMFEDVYWEKPPHLVRQEAGLRDHLRRHGVSFQ